MPKGIVILDFDEFEGAVVYFKFPEDLEIDDKYLQQITISHNFVSSIMVQRDDTINTISFYNEETGKTIILFLTLLEDGQDYYEIIKQIDKIFFEDLSDNEIFSKLRDMFQLSFSVFKVREQVMLKLANEVSDLKSFEHDIKHRIEKMVEICEEPKTLILMNLIFAGKVVKEELYSKIKDKISEKSFERTLKLLMEKNLIKYYPKTDMLRITF